MAEFSGPWPHQTDFSLDAFRRHFRQARDSGVVYGLEVTAGTGQQVIVAGGQAYVDGLMYRTSLDPTPADITLIAPTNTAAQPRRHLAVLRLDPSDTTAGTQGAIKLAVKVGAAASSPTDPAVTQTDTGIWEMPLASWQMPGSASPQNPTGFTDLRVTGAAVELAASNSTGPNSSPWGCGTLSVVAGNAPGVTVSGESIVLQPGWYHFTWVGRAAASPMLNTDSWMSLAQGWNGGSSLLSTPIAVGQSMATLHGQIRVATETAYFPVVRITTAATVVMTHRFMLSRQGR